MSKWLEPQENRVPEALQAAVGGHPLVAQALVQRGFVSLQAAGAFLDPDLYTPADPEELPGLARAVERLQQAISLGESICVWGDFDVDGQTATTLLVSALGELGARVRFHIPLRASESHGVNLPVLKRLIDEGVQLLLTCDTGIAAGEAVAYAGERGVDVIVSDHHDLPAVLPSAQAIVNPKLLADGHPLGSLPGVGVAYKLAEGLYRQAGRPQDCAAHLDLAALGIVADVALLTGDARYLLQRGLQVLRQNRRPGLRAMLELAELNPELLTEEHIGFVIAPRLNALGRLSDANQAVEFFTTRETGRARILALELQGLNARRKLLTDQVLQGALAQIEGDPSLLEQAALVLDHPAWPAGVIGIVASRLVERFHKPVVLIAAPPGEMGRGSARSIEGLNITAAIASQAEILLGFGGHPMAAGLSIDPQRIPEFRSGLSRAVRASLAQVQVEEALQIDGYLSLSELTMDLAAELGRLAPFGPGNPPLTLVSRGLHLASHRAIGKDGEHLQLVVEDETGATQRVIWWQGAGWPLPEGRFDLAYNLRASTYAGQRGLQVEWVDFRLLEAPPILIKTPLRPGEVLDYRQEIQPMARLQSLLAQGLLQVWGEAEARRNVHGRSRYELQPCDALAIWTTPPGRDELLQALDKAAPRRVALFAVDPEAQSFDAFVQRLAGLVKYALNNTAGQASIAALAAATAQREAAVRLGVAWLEASGHVRLTGGQEAELQFEPGDGQKLGGLAEIALELKYLLDESTAYRRYFRYSFEEALFPE